MNALDFVIGLKERSLDEQSSRLWRAVSEKYGSADSGYVGFAKEKYWVATNGNFEDHVILTDGNCFYSVDYTDRDGEIVFSDKMTKVKQVWVPVELESGDAV